MERNSPVGQGYKLESQIREAYGKVIYDQICHEKVIRRLISINNKIKIWQVILSSITTGSFIITLAADERISGFVGSALSVVLLILNAFVKNFDMSENAGKHQRAYNVLWKISEEYVSLLTDFEMLSPEEIMAKRDQLQNRTASVYNGSPRIDARSCKEAKKSLKKLESQTFNEKEIDAMLPNAIRRRNRDMTEENT